MILEGKRLLITGVVTKDSIAWEVARQAQEAGAEVGLTGFGRARRMTERAAARLPGDVDVLELDVNSEADLDALQAELMGRWGALDGVLHYSRRSAQMFLTGARTAGRLNAALAMPHFCISSEVAAPLRAAGAATVKVAPRPEEAALIELLG